MIVKLSNSNVVKVRSGWNHSVAILENGTVYCWGRGDFGQLGNALMKNNYEPELVELSWKSGSHACKEAACGARHTIFITSSGVGLGCGANDQGQLGIGNRAS